MHPQHMILWRKLKITYFIIFILTPDFPHFYCMLGGNLGSLLYGDVSMMNCRKKDLKASYGSLSS